MNRPLPPCPHCKKPDVGFYQNAVARGTVELCYSQDGEYEEAFSEKVGFYGSDTIRCSGCLKIRRDVRCFEREIVLA